MINPNILYDIICTYICGSRSTLHIHPVPYTQRYKTTQSSQMSRSHFFTFDPFTTDTKYAYKKQVQT